MTSRPLSVRIALAVVLALSGCSVASTSDSSSPVGPGGKADDPSAEPDADTDAAVDAGTGDADAPPAVPIPALARSYAASIRVISEERNRDTGSVLDNETLITALMRTTQSADALESPQIEFALCTATVPPVGDKQPTVPDETVQAVPAVIAPAHLRVTEAGEIEFLADEAAAQLGIRFADPMHDTMPVNRWDTRLTDDDGDENIGITFYVGMFWRIYGAARGHFGMDGTVGVDGTISGDLVSPTINVGIYDDNIVFYDAAADYAAGRARIEILSETGTFTLVPIPAGTAANCDAVASML